MNENQLQKILSGKKIALLDPHEENAVVTLAEVIETHPTGCTGPLRIVRFQGAFGALEQLRPREWILRPLADEDEVRRFVDERLIAYDRMWDG